MKRSLWSSRRQLLQAVIVLGAALLALGLGAQPSKKSWNFDFDTDKTGGGLRHFTDVAGAWMTLREDNAPSKPMVVAQTAKNVASTFNLLYAGVMDYKDVDVSVKIKAISGKEDQGGGLVWRAKNDRNYYVVRYNPVQGNYRVYMVKSGRLIQFVSLDIKSDKNWHTLRVVMQGDLIKCYLDGKKYLEFEDSTFPASGRIGLWTLADARTYFDDLTIATP
jgi:hypothetical protein